MPFFLFKKIFYKDSIILKFKNKKRKIKKCIKNQAPWDLIFYAFKAADGGCRQSSKPSGH